MLENYMHCILLGVIFIFLLFHPHRSILCKNLNLYKNNAGSCVCRYVCWHVLFRNFYLSLELENWEDICIVYTRVRFSYTSVTRAFLFKIKLFDGGEGGEEGWGKMWIFHHKLFLKQNFFKVKKKAGYTYSNSNNSLRVHPRSSWKMLC